MMFRDLFKTDEVLPMVECEEKPWIKPYLIWLNSYWTGHSKVSTCTDLQKFHVPGFDAERFRDGLWRRATSGIPSKGEESHGRQVVARVVSAESVH